MQLKDIALIRLQQQQISEAKYKDSTSLVEWMGALQAQDFGMVKWALGLRLAGSHIDQVNQALDKGSIIRTHVLRPTWHIVAASDLRGMLALSAHRIKASMVARNKQLELTSAVYKKSHRLIEKLLRDNGPLLRDEIAGQLQKARIATHDSRLLHLLMQAELDCIICSGPHQGNQLTYALLDERVPPSTYNRDQALGKLALQYFTSHGPATVQDFAWWAGQTQAVAREALDMIRSSLIQETIGQETYWMTAQAAINTKSNSVYLLPAFDEFLISYKDRTAALAQEHQPKAFSNNGIFKPVIVHRGQVIGLWKRSSQKGELLIETTFFKAPATAIQKQVKTTAARIAHFLDAKNVTVIPQ